MAVTPQIIVKLDWLISVTSKVKIIYLYQSDFTAFSMWYGSLFDRSKKPPCTNRDVGFTDTGHMTYKGCQVRLDPTGRVRL